MTPGGILFPAAATTPQCFGDGTHAFVIVRHVGAGLVVGLGDNRLLTNQYLRYADNAGLLTALVAPASGATVRIMLGTSAPPVAADVGTGNEKLADLVRPGIWMALTQLALAFIVFCIARSVRPGRAVREPQPTPIAGNELVLATGNLMQRAHHHQRAGWLIRGELYRQLCSHYRTSNSVSIDDLAALVHRRTGVPAGDIADALRTEATDSASLLHLAARLDDLRAVTIQKNSRIPENV